MQAVALPIPAITKADDGRWKVLPGAPLAWVTGRIDGYADAHTIGEWFEKFGDFPPSIKAQVVHYLTKGAGTVSRSFVSRPLVWRGNQSECSICIPEGPTSWDR